MILSKINEKLFNNKILATIIGWSIMTTVFFIDLKSGDEYRFTVFYQLAVVYFAWYFGFWYVLGVCLVASTLRVFTVYLAGDVYTSFGVPIVNTMARFTTFILTAYIMIQLRKGLLAQKNANQKLLSANNEIKRLAEIKSEFTSVVSHELRTPLTVIKEGIGIVQDGSAGPINPNQQKYLDLAKKNIDRLSRLINDVLDFQKMTSPQSESRLIKTSINKMLGAAKETFTVVAANKSVVLATELAADLPELMLDRDKIIQVLTNLIANALKVTDKGKITLRSKRLGNGIRVEVEDQGPGIKNEDLPKLFQPFSQLTSGSERKTGGTGLGLAISKQIIELHHGKIGVESVFGQGATFYFLLPVEERRNLSGGSNG